MTEGPAPTVVWEAAKENIQPLRRGRNITFLTEALTMNSDMLEEKKREFEEALRAYDGDDPLEVWDSYLTWLEEHYPSGLHALNWPQLLENCISAFILEPEHRYDNDPRFVRVWLKFANLQVHPEEVYKCMSARGVGVRSAAFYIEWSNFHEVSGEPRTAQEILEKGVQMLAQPQEQVFSALKELILRLAQGSTRPQEETAPTGADDAENRSAFSRLCEAPGQTAPIVNRIDVTRASRHPGTIQQTAPLSSVRTAFGGARGISQSKLAVFVDEAPSRDGLFTGMGTLAGSASQSHKLGSEKENSKKTGKWGREKIRQRVAPREGPAFQVVQDKGTVEDSTATSDFVTPAKSRFPVYLGSGLSTRTDKVTEMALSHIFGRLDAPDINEKRMYDFLAVYAGTCEFQFEEIRMARYKRQQKAAASRQPPLQAQEETTAENSSTGTASGSGCTEGGGLQSVTESSTIHSAKNHENSWQPREAF
ncbi:mitotic checkpoint serine/threonine-protein kinase BUB1 beta-like [Varroa jacobsoni]|uniref:mitotic checkpoint serine/threonine-protein kinase BUB1 beta-like n=1 Tax=Varroa jacobsoni TaxID=62625 RepID=UPI000BF5D837|nr:mitotic checkpoint serine/threonine-protein kinase BUB1 beta-like [Varroa jacobsoni]